MAVGGFNELELLSQEELIVGAIRQFLRAYAELSRRGEITKDFLKSICDFSLETQVWFILWEGGGAQRFTEILRVVGCSRASLSDVLRELLKTGLVRMAENRYQAVSPAWLVHFSELNRRKV